MGGWGVAGHDGKAAFAKVAILPVKNEKGKAEIKVTQQSVFCDIDFHMINPGPSFSCYCRQGRMRKVLCSQATPNVSSSV